MSVLDAFFGRGGAFRGARCKTLLKLTIPRIKLLRNRREMHLKQMRRDIANLLASGQEATARIRVEHIIREENTMAAQEILELFCELIVVRLPIIELQRECPLDLKEAISSICFAAPRCADLVELQQAQMMFAAKYGRDFVYAATELLPDSGVNRQIIELLSVRAPPIEAKLKLLKEIAEEHGVDWEPLQSETEHEDLLNGPSLLVNSLVRSQEPSSLQESKSDSEGEVDFLDLPEVPNRAVPPPSPPKTMDQFLPFIVPPLDPVVPSLHPMVRPLAPVGPPLDPVVRPLAPVVPPLDPVVRPLAPVVPPLDPVVRSLDPVVPPPDPVVSPLDPLVPQVKSWQPAVEEPETLSSATISSRRSELDKDLQDAAAAANAAAETAERAAAAARLAARLAQVKMTQLVKTGMERDDDPRRDPFESFPTKEEDLSAVMMPEAEETRAALPDGRQTLRSTSLEDDPYFSYPNLFSRQNSSVIESPLVARSSGTDSSPR